MLVLHPVSTVSTCRKWFTLMYPRLKHKGLVTARQTDSERAFLRAETISRADISPFYDSDSDGGKGGDFTQPWLQIARWYRGSGPLKSASRFAFNADFYCIFCQRFLNFQDCQFEISIVWAKKKKNLTMCCLHAVKSFPKKKIYNVSIHSFCMMRFPPIMAGWWNICIGETETL